MDLLAVFKSGHSADGILIGNVKSYLRLSDGVYVVTYEEKGELFDIVLKHVKKLKEVE